MTASSRVDEIHALLRLHAGAPEVLTEDTELHADLGLISLDLHEFLEEFAERFQVDMSGFLWYFHSEEDGLNPFRWIFPAPQDRVTRIPLRLALFYRAAEIGKWPVEYPEHSLPVRRWDLVLCRCLGAVAFFWLGWELAQALF